MLKTSYLSGCRVFPHPACFSVIVSLGAMAVQSERFSESGTLTVSNPETGGSVRDILSLAEAQKVLFSEKLNWADLTAVDLAGGEKMSIFLISFCFPAVAGICK